MAEFPIQSATLKLLEEALSTLDSNEEPGLLSDKSNIDSAFSKCFEIFAYFSTFSLSAILHWSKKVAWVIVLDCSPIVNCFPLLVLSVIVQ